MKHRIFHALILLGIIAMLCAPLFITHGQQLEYRKVSIDFRNGTQYATTLPAWRVSATDSAGTTSNWIIPGAAPLTQTWNVGSGNVTHSIDELAGKLHLGDTVLLAPGQTSTTTGFSIPSGVTVRTAGSPRHVLKLVNPHSGSTPTVYMGGTASKLQNVNLDGPDHQNRINYGGTNCEIVDVELLGAPEYGINANAGFNGLKVSGLTHRGPIFHTMFYTGIGGDLSRSCRGLVFTDFDLEMTAGQHMLRWYGIKNCQMGSPDRRSKLTYANGRRGCINMKQGDGLLIVNVDQDGGGFGLGPLPEENAAYRLTNVIVRNCTLKPHDYLELEWGLVDARFEDCVITTPQTPLTTTGPVAGRFAPTATFTRCRFYCAGKTQVYKGAVHGTYINCTLNDRPLGADGKVH